MDGLKQVRINPPDHVAIERIVRQILARLNASEVKSSGMNPSGPTPAISATGSKTSRTASYLADRVITADRISRLPKPILVALICDDAVITPSAFDEAKTRGIEINRVQRTEPSESSSLDGDELIMDDDQSDRGTAFANQLQKRGINTLSSRIILSDTPAKELERQIRVNGEVAALVGSIEEARRFSRELKVTTWIFDMQRLNLVAAVNVASVIARTAVTRTENKRAENKRTEITSTGKA